MKTKFQCVQMLPDQYSTEDGGIKTTKSRCGHRVEVEGTFCQAHSHQGALGAVDYSPLYGAVIDDILMTATQAEAYLKAKKGGKAPKTMTSKKTKTQEVKTMKTNEKKEEGIMFTLLWWMMWFTTQIEVAKDGRLYTHNSEGKSVFVKKSLLKGNNLETLIHAMKGFGDQFVPAEVEDVEIKKEEKVNENIPCPACKGSGRWVAQTGWVGPCHRCESKGFQTPSDIARNKAYDDHGRTSTSTRDSNTRYVVFTAHGLTNGRIKAIKVLPLRPENNLISTAALLQKLYAAEKVPANTRYIWIMDGNVPFKLLMKGRGQSWANYTARPLPQSISF